MKYPYQLSIHFVLLLALMPIAFAGNGEVRLEIQMKNAAVSIGDHIECTITLRNNSKLPVDFIPDTVTDKDPGIRFNLIDDSTGKLLAMREKFWNTDLVYRVDPDAEHQIGMDLSVFFDITKPGTYRVQACYGIYAHHIRNSGTPEETSEIQTLLSADSNWATFRVRENEETRLRIEAVQKEIRSANKSGQKLLIEKLKTQDASILRAMGDTLLNIANGSDQSLILSALDVIMTKIADLATPEFEKELVRLFERLSADKDAEIRLAAARALKTCYGGWKNNKVWDDFETNGIRRWIKRESSGECRAILVGFLRGGPRNEEFIELIDKDPSVNVKLAAVKRYRSLHPDGFMVSAVRFADRTDKIQIDGVDTTLGAFIVSEIERLKALRISDGLPLVEVKQNPETNITQQVEDKSVVVVNIGGDGKLSVAGTETTREDLVDRINRIRGDGDKNECKIQIIVPRAMDRLKIREIMDKLADAGYWNQTVIPRESD